MFRLIFCVKILLKRLDCKHYRTASTRGLKVKALLFAASTCFCLGMAVPVHGQQTFDSLPPRLSLARRLKLGRISQASVDVKSDPLQDESPTFVSIGWSDSEPNKIDPPLTKNSLDSSTYRPSGEIVGVDINKCVRASLDFHNTLDSKNHAHLGIGLGIFFDPFAIFGHHKACSRESDKLKFEAVTSRLEGNRLWGLQGGRHWNDPIDPESLRQAVNTYIAAADYYQQLNDHRNQALMLRRVGMIYQSSGTTLSGKPQPSLQQFPEAIDYYQKALEIYRSLKDYSSQIATLNDLGSLYASAGNQPKATDFYNNALEILRNRRDSIELVITLNNLAHVYRDQKNYEQAKNVSNQLLSEAQKLSDNSSSNFSFLRASLLNNVAIIFNESGQYQKALENLNQALPFIAESASSESASLKAETLLRIARIENSQDDFPSAKEKTEEAIQAIKTRPEACNSGKYSTPFIGSSLFSQESKTHYDIYFSYYDCALLNASNQKYYKFATELLQQQYFKVQDSMHAALALEALEVNEDTRARSLRLILAEANTAPPKKSDVSKLSDLTLKDIQSLLDDDTLILEYAFGKEHSYLWEVSKTGAKIEISSYEIPGQEEIESAAREFYGFLTIPSKRIRPKSTANAGFNLSQKILKPVAKHLARKRLLIVADGFLNYIPFSALPTPQPNGIPPKIRPVDLEPLLVNHEIISAPSISTLIKIRDGVALRERPSRYIAIVADPVFSDKDERITKKDDSSTTTHPSSEDHGFPIANIPANIPIIKEPTTEESSTYRNRTGFVSIPQTLLNSPDAQPSSPGTPVRRKNLSRLSGTAAEAKAIQEAVGNSLSSTSALYLGFDASLEGGLKESLGQYQFIHFATHGFFDDKHPENSGIMLSQVNQQGMPQRSFLSLRDLFDPAIHLSADLVVVSGCQTGEGKLLAGEGLVGLTQGFIVAGAPRVVVSLWSVQDKPTAELMAKFYRGIFQDNLTPAAALKKAQLSIWHSRQGVARWETPYFWAGFTFQGDWKDIPR